MWLVAAVSNGSDIKHLASADLEEHNNNRVVIVVIPYCIIFQSTFPGK